MGSAENHAATSSCDEYDKRASSKNFEGTLRKPRMDALSSILNTTGGCDERPFIKPSLRQLQVSKLQRENMQTMAMTLRK